MKASVMDSNAIISSDGRYRYKLGRYWTQRKAPLVWIMLNPSTADAEKDDHTIRRCISFAKRWGFGGIEVYNLFALRSRHPTSIEMADDPVGPENDDWLKAAARSGRKIVAAWGACRTLRQSQRAAHVMKLLVRFRNAFPVSLGVTKTGDPRHPLYVRADALPRPLPCPLNSQ